MEPQDLEKGLLTVSGNIKRLAVDAANKEANYLDQKELLDIYLEEIKNFFDDDSTKKITQTELVRLAVTSEQYKAKLVTMQEARRAYMQSKAQHKGEEALLDSLRSISSLEKVKLNLM